MYLPVRTLVYIGGPDRAKELEEHFPEFKFPMFSGKMGADVVEKEASKAKGLLRICQHYGISMERTVAFGDSMNDYEVVQEAGIGIAMGNAVEELRMVILTGMGYGRPAGISDGFNITGWEITYG